MGVYNGVFHELRQVPGATSLRRGGGLSQLSRWIPILGWIPGWGPNTIPPLGLWFPEGTCPVGS